jgi:hypothetical protein
MKARLDSIAPPATQQVRRGFGGPPQAAAPTLQSVQATLLAAAMSMQNADVGVTARQIDAVEKARVQYKDVMARWDALKAGKR